MAKRTKKPANLGGRPPKWATPDELEQCIGHYFHICEKDKVLPNKAGLALALDTTRETLGDYLDKPGFSDSLKKAYARIEDAWIGRLGAQGQATGPIFYLKNAFSKEYRDKVETDITTGGEKLESSADIAALAAEAARLLKEKKL